MLEINAVGPKSSFSHCCVPVRGWIPYLKRVTALFRKRVARLSLISPVVSYFQTPENRSVNLKSIVIQTRKWKNLPSQANQRVRKALFTCVVYKIDYSLISTVMLSQLYSHAASTLVTCTHCGRIFLVCVFTGLRMSIASTFSKNCIKSCQTFLF